MYTGYKLTPESKKLLLNKFPPKYDKVICDHITYKFGTSKDEPVPPTVDETIVVGYVDSGDGVEGLVVALDGNTKRPDGKLYHITLSLAPNRKAVETNNYVNDAESITPVKIDTIPTNFYSASKS
jgi:hypothetical protein